MKYKLNRQLKQGSGKPLVFLHGLGSSGRYWRPVFEQLPKDVKASGYDLLGYGESPQPQPYDYTAAEQAKALHQTLRWHYPMRKVTLVGHSMGGLVALEFARRYPNKVSTLILANVPVLLSDKDLKLVKNRYAEVGDRIRNELHKKTVQSLHSSKLVKEKVLPRYAQHKLKKPEYDNYDMEHASQYAYGQSLKNIIAKQDTLGIARQVTVPTIIVQADRDRAVIAGNIDKLTVVMPHAKLVRVAGTHQFPILEPQKFVQILDGIYT